MKDRIPDEVLNARKNAYLEHLYQEAIKGNVEAGDELSNIALGGSERARELVSLFDSFPTEDIYPCTSPSEEPEPTSKIKTVTWITRHPRQAIRAGVRQILVKIEHEAPPHTSTWEEFPELPIDKAAEAIRLAETSRIIDGGVRREDWSPGDQKLMAEGLKPQGHPEHPNI